MDIGTIISGLNALGGLFGGNDPIPMTPAQAEGDKPKKQGVQQPSMFVVLPNQTPPMGVGVPPAFPLAGMLANQLYRLPQQQPAMNFPALLDLYRLFYGTRF